LDIESQATTLSHVPKQKKGIKRQHDSSKEALKTEIRDSDEIDKNSDEDD
jgi:hypothetical protein